MEVLRLEKIVKVYNEKSSNPVEALKGVDLSFEKGDTISIQGVSGSGKSTLLNILGCLDSFTSGKYILDGKQVDFSNSKEIAEIRNKKIGFVLQNYGLLPEQNVIENVALPLLFSDIKLKKANEMAMESLEKINMGEFKKKKVKELSGGQQQRIAIARAMVNNPEIILADEPTGALDSETGEQVIDTLLSLSELGKTIIIVTHDNNIAEKCNIKLHIKDGKLI